jgi:hypothetical protein
MNKRALLESTVVALATTFAHYTPMAQVQSLASALRENAERRERRRASRLGPERGRDADDAVR